MMDSTPPKAFVVDVDGVMTTGHSVYTADGKRSKIFGPDDHDALLLLKPHLDIHFVTGDHRGFSITKRRIVQDMKFPLQLISSQERIPWIQTRWPLKTVIYMGDSFADAHVFEKIGYAIAPQNAFFTTKKKAHYVTQGGGGNRAVAEACLHIIDKFFGHMGIQT